VSASLAGHVVLEATIAGEVEIDWDGFVEMMAGRAAAILGRGDVVREDRWRAARPVEDGGWHFELRSAERGGVKGMETCARLSEAGLKLQVFLKQSDSKSAGG
jgi:hypothetical protein